MDEQMPNWLREEIQPTPLDEMRKDRDEWRHAAEAGIVVVRRAEHVIGTLKSCLIAAGVSPETVEEITAGAQQNAMKENP